MAARTRTAIKTLVEAHTGRVKDTLENSLCDSALKFALFRHDFKDAQSIPSDITITEDATSVSLSSVSGLISIVSMRIVEASGSRNRLLPLKTRLWWDENVINPEDNQKGWPFYGLRVGATIQLDRPAESGLELRMRVTTEQAFATDATVCPIYVLDLFVEHYVTAHVFKSLEEESSYAHWITSALGARYLVDGSIGGELANAIEADTSMDSALELQSEGPMRPTTREGGVSITNEIVEHDDYGNTRWWF